MDLSIIIVSWNVCQKLEENLERLFASKKINFSDKNRRNFFKAEVFVIDNNSSDDSVYMLRKKFPLVKLISNQENFGFARANNQAIKRAKGDFILLLNPDMKVFENTLEKMIDWMHQKSAVSVATCKLVNQNNQVVRDNVRKFPKFLDQILIIFKIPHLFPRIIKKYRQLDFDYDKEARVDSVRGAFFFIRRNFVESVCDALDNNISLPFLDEKYFLWFEEVDFCKQVYKKGGQVWYTPITKCVNYIGSSFSQVDNLQKQKYFSRSMIVYFSKWHSVFSVFLLKISWLVVLSFYNLVNLFTRKKFVKL